PFDFNEPSPDDMVLEKRKQAFKQKKSEQYNIKSDTKPAAAKPAAGGAKPQQPATPKKAPAAAAATAAEEKEKEKEAEVDSVAKALDEVSLSEKIAKKQVKQMPDGKRREIEAQIKAEQQSEGSKRNLSMVVIGHVDAGKSTIMGHLLHLCGHVDKKTITKYERDSKVLGKGSFSFAWVLDEQEEERARGVTMDVAVRRLETENRRITLLDAPGHRDFVPNMLDADVSTRQISGTAQADVAVLVIDSSPGEFEAGFAADGQTKEHALLARSLGVMQLTVVVNKMDAVDWSKERFEEVQNIVGAFLKQAGFLLKNVTWVPCSGLTGENLIARKDPKLTAWYSGPTLVQSIDSFRPGQRPTEKPLRFCVSDVFKSGSLGVGAVGKVETGIVSVGDKAPRPPPSSLLVMPIGELCTVKSIQAHEESVKWAQAGDNVELTVQGLDVVSFKVGSVLCDPEHPVRVATAFKAQIYVFPTQIPIIKGFQAVMHTHTLHEPAHLSKLVAIIDQASGEVKKKRPRCLTEKMTAVVEVVTLKPVCIELFRDYKQLGRFMLRSGGRTVAAGLISEIIH
ncbi:HBS1like, putative, partial [Acanthamoeba castellanii str. Neff]